MILLRCRWPAGFFVLFLVLPAAADDQNKDGNRTSPATAQDYLLLQQLGEVAGRLMRVDDSGSLTLRVEYPLPQGNAARPGGMVRPQRPRRGNNPAAELRRRILQAQRQQAAAKARVAVVHKDFELETADQVTVRLARPPAEYDDKGNLKKFTNQELRELRGPDPKLPGYAASFDSLRPGQIVQLTLARMQADGTTGSKPQVTRILILDPDGTLPSGPPRRGKNQKN